MYITRNVRAWLEHVQNLSPSKSHLDDERFSQGEVNKHRGNATCAKNYDACPKRVVQQSFFAKSLVFGTTVGRSAATCGEETQAKFLYR